jgi:hypothetical protein
MAADGPGKPDATCVDTASVTIHVQLTRKGIERRRGCGPQRQNSTVGYVQLLKLEACKRGTL